MRTRCQASLVAIIVSRVGFGPKFWAMIVYRQTRQGLADENLEASNEQAWELKRITIHR